MIMICNIKFTVTIIKKYSTDDEQAPLLPLISHQKTNLYLKEMAKVCEIDKLLTFQTAVRSFIRNALASGATIDSISHMVGKPLSQVESYARFSPERLEEEMSVFASRMGREQIPWKHKLLNMFINSDMSVTACEGRDAFSVCVPHSVPHRKCVKWSIEV